MHLYTAKSVSDIVDAAEAIAFQSGYEAAKREEDFKYKRRISTKCPRCEHGFDIMIEALKQEAK